MEVSNCCGASFYEPGYPDNDICSSCKEHASPMEEETDFYDGIKSYLKLEEEWNINNDSVLRESIINDRR